MQLPHELVPFSSTLQRTQAWMKDMMAALEVDDPHKAYRAMRASLHAIRDRIPTDEALHLGSQLPLPVLGVYFDGYRAADAPDPTRHERDFLERVRGEIAPAGDLDPRQAVEATLKTLRIHTSEGQFEQVRELFHKELQGLWQEATA